MRYLLIFLIRHWIVSLHGWNSMSLELMHVLSARFSELNRDFLNTPLLQTQFLYISSTQFPFRKNVQLSTIIIQITIYKLEVTTKMHYSCDVVSRNRSQNKNKWQYYLMGKSLLYWSIISQLEMCHYCTSTWLWALLSLPLVDSTWVLLTFAKLLTYSTEQQGKPC